VYAVAALRGGAETVDVGYAFLEAPEAPVLTSFAAADLPALEGDLRAHARGIAAQEFHVSGTPDRELCRGCPGRGGLCSWPVEATMRDPAVTSAATVLGNPFWWADAVAALTPA